MEAPDKDGSADDVKALAVAVATSLAQRDDLESLLGVEGVAAQTKMVELVRVPSPAPSQQDEEESPPSQKVLLHRSREALSQWHMAHMNISWYRKQLVHWETKVEATNAQLEQETTNLEVARKAQVEADQARSAMPGGFKAPYLERYRRIPS